jgi:hypothetical protein
MNKNIIPFIVLALIILASCGQLNKTKSQTNTKPSIAKGSEANWIQKKIKELEAAPPKKAKSYIMQYEYNGRLVYYIPADCCDQLNPLYDEKGNIICKPDGGFTGKGDGKCPDFLRANLKGKKIWSDIRQTKEIDD